MGGFTIHVTDTNVATDISKIDHAEIPDMWATQPQSPHWIPNYVLNSALRGSVPSPQREYRFNFPRRAMIACSEHVLARHATLSYLEEEKSFRNDGRAAQPPLQPGEAHRVANHQRADATEGATRAVAMRRGLRSTDCEVTFAETGEILAAIGDWAHVLEDPLTSADRLKALREASAEVGTA
jgi:hypothetical protein